MTGEVRVVFIVVPLPQMSESAMAKLPLPPVRFPRLPGSLPTHVQLPPLWVTVQPAGGKRGALEGLVHASDVQHIAGSYAVVRRQPARGGRARDPRSARRYRAAAGRYPCENTLGVEGVVLAGNQRDAVIARRWIGPDRQPGVAIDGDLGVEPPAGSRIPDLARHRVAGRQVEG